MEKRTEQEDKKYSHIKTASEHYEAQSLVNEIGEEEYNRRLTIFLENNHQKYLKDSSRIGFDNFEEEEGSLIDTMVIDTKCGSRQFDVSFRVTYCKLKFKNFSVHGIYTTPVKIGHRLLLGGFGSHSYIDESATMKLGVVEMAKKCKLMIVNDYNSWPNAAVIVQKVSDVYLRTTIQP